eukprot:scaffold55983_cov45-Phaeocystis_antarctica.AAC.1
MKTTLVFFAACTKLSQASRHYRVSVCLYNLQSGLLPRLLVQGNTKLKVGSASQRTTSSVVSPHRKVFAGENITACALSCGAPMGCGASREPAGPALGSVHMAITLILCRRIVPWTSTPKLAGRSTRSTRTPPSTHGAAPRGRRPRRRAGHHAQGPERAEALQQDLPGGVHLRAHRAQGATRTPDSPPPPHTQQTDGAHGAGLTLMRVCYLGPTVTTDPCALYGCRCPRSSSRYAMPPRATIGDAAPANPGPVPDWHSARLALHTVRTAASIAWACNARLALRRLPLDQLVLRLVLSLTGSPADDGVPLARRRRGACPSRSLTGSSVRRCSTLCSNPTRDPVNSPNPNPNRDPNPNPNRDPSRNPSRNPNPNQGCEEAILQRAMTEEVALLVVAS